MHDGGHLWIGSKDCPIRSKVTITLFGLTQSPKSNPPLLNANKVLGGFSGSQIDIHGVPGSPTWTVLGKTVRSSSTSTLLPILMITRRRKAITASPWPRT